MPNFADSVSTHQSAVVQRVSLIVRNRLRTATNTFGLWKEYLYRPSHDPDAFVSAEDLYQPHATAIHAAPNNKVLGESSGYSSRTTELLLNWQHTGSSKKSNIEINRLVRQVLCHCDFRLEHLELFDARHENLKVDLAQEKSDFLRTFHHAAVNIKVPSGSKHVAPRTLSIPGLYY